jgi:hypothetical protein
VPRLGSGSLIRVYARKFENINSVFLTKANMELQAALNRLSISLLEAQQPVRRGTAEMEKGES